MAVEAHLKLLSFGLVAVASFISAEAGAAPNPRAREMMPDPALRFTILYDNYLYKEGTQADWGFSCLIEGTEQTILFDTGTKPSVLIQNVAALGVDLTRIDQIVLSHQHDDHVVGVFEVLKRNPDVTVFYPVSFQPPLALRLERLKPRARRRPAKWGTASKSSLWSSTRRAGSSSSPAAPTRES